MITNTRNFKFEEFQCRHCGENKIQQVVLELCQKIRDFVGRPIIITSGYRCPEHNRKIGGVPNSSHVKGLSANLKCSIGAEALYIAIQSLYDLGEIQELKSCYYKKTFVHVDCDCGQKGNHEIFQGYDKRSY